MGLPGARTQGDPDLGADIQDAKEPAPDSDHLGSDDTDPDLVAVGRILEGDESAYVDIVERHEVRLRRVVLGIVGEASAAEDVLQDVFLIVYRKLPDFRREAPFGAWLHRITVREAIRARSRWRRLWRRWMPLEYADREVRREHRETAGELSDELKRALALLERLPRRSRVAFVLSVVEELSYEEIGQLLGCSSGTVGSLIHRARARLAEMTDGATAMVPERAAEAGRANAGRQGPDGGLTPQGGRAMQGGQP